MIVWLASYPRSGNTLLRTVFWQTMGLASYSDEPGEAALNTLTETALRATGKIILDRNWDVFYKEALSSEKVYLIKTHRLPRDNQPAIYIVRDGRNSYLSYSSFHRKTSPPPHPSLLDLLIGNLSLIHI